MAAMAAEGGAVDRAHQRLNDAEKELREAKAKLDAAEVAQPLNEKRVAKAEVGVAEAKWASADDAGKETYKGLLDAAKDTLRTAQEALHNANEGLRIANTAYERTLPAAAPGELPALLEPTTRTPEPHPRACTASWPRCPPGGGAEGRGDGG
mmetsp:Transcript_18244/g.35613  ORF Transcript_18244/g.35613 Transcript_18244/m.35613 type:complete len:152 (+) Transcript_18244:192-647(+)